MEIMWLTSASNPKLKEAALLQKKRKARDEGAVFVAEGIRLFTEIPKERLVHVFVSESFYETEEAKALLSDVTVNIYGVKDSIFASICDTKNPQGILAIVRKEEKTLSDILKLSDNPFFMMAENLQDPGNLGTIVRLADWFGIEHIFCSKGTADIYNPKAVQATMGAVARVSLHYLNLEAAVSSLPSGVPVYGTFMDGADIYKEQLSRNGVIVMGNETMKLLFGDEEPHVGEYVNLYEVPFLIVGMYKTKEQQRNQELIAPITTVSSLYKPSGYFSNITMKLENLETAAENEAFNTTLRTAMSRHKQYDPEDSNAIWIRNVYEQFLQIMMVLNGLKYFIWIIGLATLIAGVTGISNIMLITVRERTREFGIRKAIGASPRSIVMLGLFESIAIAMVFGYIGMLLGIGVTSLVNFVLEQMASSGESGIQIFKDPTVDMGIIIGANCIMILAGLIAGYIPARRAVNIKPIEALTAT